MILGDHPVRVLSTRIPLFRLLDVLEGHHCVLQPMQALEGPALESVQAFIARLAEQDHMDLSERGVTRRQMHSGRTGV